MNQQKKIPIQNIGYLCTDWQEQEGHTKKIALKWISTSLELFEYTFQDLTTMSNKAANVLLKYQVTKGDRVMILLPKSPELYTIFLGALKLG